MTTFEYDEIQPYGGPHGGITNKMPRVPPDGTPLMSGSVKNIRLWLEQHVVAVPKYLSVSGNPLQIRLRVLDPMRVGPAREIMDEVFRKFMPIGVNYQIDVTV